MKAEPPVGCLYGLENLRMTVAEWVGRPTILEINVALAVQIPDEITLRLVDKFWGQGNYRPQCATSKMRKS
jgi:hypothetical protein